jgi:hypothetical protein
MTISFSDAASGLLLRLRRRRVAAITNLTDRTSTDPSTGAVRSVQTADVILAEPALREIWSAENLERLARTYWRFLARVTLGVVHVHYRGSGRGWGRGRSRDSGQVETSSGRAVVLLVPALKLISFAEPEYEMDESQGLVRWRIQGGILVAGPRRRSKGARDQGHLQIRVRRLTAPPAAGQAAGDAPSGAGANGATGASEATPSAARVHVEIEVASFYPAIAFAVSRRLYDLTQSRLHVLITHAFLRSLVRARGSDAVPQLAGSKVRRFAAVRERRLGGDDSEPPAAQGA